MARTVKVTVKAKQVGTWTTAPFSHESGLDMGAIYEVPIYEIAIEPKYFFKAVRFGLVNRKQKPPPKSRQCDAGLTAPRTVNPTWVPHYSPHSFRGAARPGAWRILPGKQFLIHEGSADKNRSIGGSLGCIEIVGVGEWNRFLSSIESEGAATSAQIGAAQTLVLKIEQASYPFAKLLS